MLTFKRPTSVFYAITLTALLASGCTWVEPIETSNAISLMDATDVQDCERLGMTTATVKDQIGWFNRGEEKVAEELLTLAQNSAINMGGNVLTATTNPLDGSQQFAIYSCPQG